MKNKITTKSIIYFLLATYLLFLEIAQFTIFYNIALIILLIAFVLLLTKRPSIKLNVFLWVYLGYIVYQLCLLVFNIPKSTSLFMESMKSLIVNFVVLFIIYNIITSLGDIHHFIKIDIVVNIISLILIVLFSKDTLFTTQLGHSYAHRNASFYMFGIPVYMSANGLSIQLACSFLFSLFYLTKDHKKRYLLLAIMFFIGILLTGSRKGILVLLIFSIWFLNNKTKGKYSKKIIGSLIIASIIYISIMNVPALYNIVGKRMIELKDYIFFDKIGISVNNRDFVKDLSIEKIKESPIIGYGEGAFKHFFGSLTESNSEINYLELMIHGGIIGLIIYYSYTIPIYKAMVLKKDKTMLFKMLTLIMVVLNIIEIGSVDYASIKILFYIILYFSNYYLEKNSVVEENIHELEIKNT